MFFFLLLLTIVIDVVVVQSLPSSVNLVFDSPKRITMIGRCLFVQLIYLCVCKCLHGKNVRSLSQHNLLCAHKGSGASYTLSIIFFLCGICQYNEECIIFLLFFLLIDRFSYPTAQVQWQREDGNDGNDDNGKPKSN